MSENQPLELDPQFRAALRDIVNRIPFNQVLGLELGHIDLDRVEIGLAMRDELVGNHFHGILHGGVIASILDVAGGCMALVGAHQRSRGLSPEARERILTRVGTIDMRVDFLRPGKGSTFLASARLLRTGNKVAVTRMELHDDRGELIALGTGTYLCG